MLLIPFMSCSARLPILVLLVGTFFPQNPILVIFGLYALTIFMAILTAILLDKVFFKTPLDLTPVKVLRLRKPKLKRVLIYTWDAGYEYLKKIGTVVLIAMMVIWFLSHFPQNKETHTCDQTGYECLVDKPFNNFQDGTYLASFGRFIEPALRPLGFDWKMSVCLTTGLAAKEFIVGTMAILYNNGDEEMQIGENLKKSGMFSPAVALSFLVFAMLYMPCIATIFTIKRESKSWWWALFSMGYSIALAWGGAFVVLKLILFLY